MILKKLLSVALVAALVVSGSLPALAFNSDDFADESETVKFPPDLFLPTIGGCTLSMVRNFGLGNVNVNITLPGGGATYYPGGSYWAGENRVTGQELTRDILAQCLDVAASQITLIYSYGAGDPLNSNYGDDTIVGFAFSVIQTVSWTDTLGTSHQLQANTAYAFQIGVDGISASNTAAPANTAPVANAGADQTVASAASVTLDGTSSSDADSDALTYTWSQTSGTSVTLSSTTAAQPTFTAPTLAVGDADAELVFSLTVNDVTVNSSADTVTITVEAPPGVSLNLTSDPETGPANEFYVEAVFGEPVAGFTADDVSISNGTLSHFTGSTSTEWSFRVTPVNDGDVTVNIAADAATAGDLGSVAASLTLTGDVTAPTGYSVSLDQDTITAGNDNAASFTFADAEVGATFAYTISSSGGGTNVTGTGTIDTTTDQITGIDVSGLGDGTLTLSVTLTDLAENEGSAVEDTATKDATAPTGHSVSFTQSGVNASNETAIGFTISNAEDGDYTYTISSNGGGSLLAGRGTIEGGSETVTGLDLSNLEDGTLTLSVVLTDAAGNEAAAVEDTVSKDGNVPDAPSAPTLADASNSGSTDDTLTNDTTPTINGTAEANATVTVYVGETEAGTASADGSGAWSFTFDEGDVAAGENSITVTATDAAGNTSQASSPLVITIDTGAPTVTLDGPTENVTADFTVTFRFSEAVTGFLADDITVTNGSKGAFSGSGTTYTLVVTPEMGTTVSVSVAANVAADDAGNGNTASDVFEVSAGSPASEFARHEEEIREVIQSEAARSLRSTVSANQRMVRDARTRFIECGQVTDEDGCLGGRNDVAFDVDGSFVLRNETLSTSGTFFQQTGNYEGTQRRLFFGDFDVQHDGDTGSTTATLTGRMAWEQMVSDRTMLGYFIGGELAYSNIDGAFEGDQDRIGATIGAYAVHQLAEQVYLDGFLTVGAGRNNLEMANDVLALESDYTTRTATIGAALSGVYDYSSYEFRPELAFTYGRTWIGNVAFTGRAYGLVDDTLSLDAGDVSIGTLILRPEVVWGLDADTLAESHTRFSFAPRLICESVDAGAVREDCGGGVELGLSSVSEDGLSEFTARVLADRIGNSNRSSFAINLEHRF